MEKRKVVHCWECGPETEDGCSTTCMLLDGHEGPHYWTRDDEIRVSFAPLPSGMRRAVADNPPMPSIPNGDLNPELYQREPCFACGQRLRSKGYLVGCKDDQTVFVGPECFRNIKAGDADGWQPPKGGPRLYLLEHTKHADPQ